MGVRIESESVSELLRNGCPNESGIRTNCSGRPRRIAIFSYQPEGSEIPADARNGPMRVAEAPYESYFESKRHDLDG